MLYLLFTHSYSYKTTCGLLEAVGFYVSTFVALGTHIAEAVKHISSHSFSWFGSLMHLQPLLMNNLQVAPMIHETVIKEVMVKVLLVA